MKEAQRAAGRENAKAERRLNAVRKLRRHSTTTFAFSTINAYL
jgi:hypothetical protein